TSVFNASMRHRIEERDELPLIVSNERTVRRKLDPNRATIHLSLKSLDPEMEGPVLRIVQLIDRPVSINNIRSGYGRSGLPSPPFKGRERSPADRMMKDDHILVRYYFMIVSIREDERGIKLHQSYSFSGKSTARSVSIE